MLGHLTGPVTEHCVDLRLAAAGLRQRLGGGVAQAVEGDPRQPGGRPGALEQGAEPVAGKRPASSPDDDRPELWWARVEGVRKQSLAVADGLDTSPATH